jgi:hypothetical protein
MGIDGQPDTMPAILASGGRVDYDASLCRLFRYRFGAAETLAATDRNLADHADRTVNER